MRMRLLLMTIIASAALSAGPGAFAQDSSQTAPQKKAKGQTKPKVWTNDEVDSLRSPSDIYMAEKQRKEEDAPMAANKQESSSASTKPPAAPPRLSNPKTVHDADGMIAWEKRDVDSQQEFVERLQKRLADAPDEEKERLQKLIREHTQSIADTRKEMEGLEAQRDALAKKAAAANGQPSPQQQ